MSKIIRTINEPRENKTETIAMRTKPCRCGCKGRDHKRTIRRKVTGIKTIYVSVYTFGKFNVHTTHAGRIKYNGETVTVYRTEIENTEKDYRFGGRWISAELEGKLF